MTTASTESKSPHKDHIPEGPHETMGQYLQRARIDQEMTLDSVAEATCIHIATIKALEEDDYDKLPAEVFVRGFIKIYATLLHLDTDKALSLYQPVPGPDRDDFSGMKGARQRILPGETLAEASPFTAGRQFLIFLLLVIIAFFTYKAFLSDHNPDVSPEGVTTSEETAIPQPGQQELPMEPAEIHPEGDAAALPTSEPQKNDDDLAAELPAAPTQPATMQPPVEEPLPAVATVPPAEERAEPLAEEEPLSVIPPVTPQQRLIIEPHRRKTVRKPQPEAVTAEGPATTDENDLSAATSEEVPAAATEPAEPVAEVPALPVESTTTATAVDSQPTTETATKPTPFVYILKANFTDLTWLEVIVDSGPQRDYTFRAGEQWEWRANKEIKLHVGNAGGVKLQLNNSPLPALGETGKSVRITLPTEPR